MEACMIRSFVEFSDEQIPILALAIHNGHEMHPVLLQQCGIDEATRLREEDPYTEEFTKPFPNRIVVYTSRFTVDLNRNPEKAIYLKPDDCWGLPVRTIMPSDVLISELKQDYSQWYSLLTYSIQKLLAKHPLIIVLDLHSYNHRRLGPDAEPDSQKNNPDIILGRNNMSEKYYSWVEKLCAEINNVDILGHRIDCRIDIKFTGGSLSRWLHVTFPDRVICLAIEFKKIFMDEWTGNQNKEFQTALSNLLFKAIESCRYI